MGQREWAGLVLPDSALFIFRQADPLMCYRAKRKRDVGGGFWPAPQTPFLGARSSNDALFLVM